MTEDWTVDLESFVTGPAEEAPPDLAADWEDLRDHFAAVTEAATAGPTDAPWISAVPCRHRTGEDACRGTIRVDRSGDPAVIRWACTACEDGGVIRGVEETGWDLSIADPHVDEDDPLEVRLPVRHHRALLSLELLDRAQRCVVATARPTEGDSVRLVGPWAVLDGLVNAVAAAANHASSVTRARQLERLYDALVEEVE